MIIIFNFFAQIYLECQRKRSVLENHLTYPSCEQGSEPNKRFYFHAPVSHCDKVNFKGEQRIRRQNYSFKSQGHYLRGS